METSQFDDFIKTNTQDELPVPTELSWENMNFALPPAKRKRRMLPWTPLLLIGILGMGSGLWYVYQQDNTQSQSLSIDSPLGIPNQNSETSLENKDHSADTAFTQDASKNTVAYSELANQAAFKKEQPAGNKVETGIETETEGVNLFSSSQSTTSNDLGSVKTETPSPGATSLLTAVGEGSQIRREPLTPCTLLEVLPIETLRSTSPEGHLVAPPLVLAPPRAKHETKSVGLLVSIGMNKAYMNHSSTSLNDTETPDWGNSYQILAEKEVKNNWLISIGSEYRRLHTTFYFEKDLGTYVDASQRQVIRQTRRVFHNNYFDFVSMNLGVGKQFQLSPRLRGQVMMYLSPSNRLSYTGKFLDAEEEILILGPNTVAQNRYFFLNADAAFRLSYQLNKTDLIIGVNLSQSLTKSDLLSVGNTMTTVQPRIFGLNLGIKRTIGM